MNQPNTSALEKQYPEVVSKKMILRSGIVVFLVKIVFAYLYCQLIFSQKPERRIGTLSYASGDYQSYIGAMENHIQGQGYYFVNQLGDTTWAGRPPHYTAPYWLARQFVDRTLSADFLTIVNVAVDSLAILCVALMAASLGRNPRKTFIVAIILGIISAFVSNWAFITLPDSPGAALFMIGLFFYWKAYSLDEKIKKNVFLSSFFFSWAIMLRPFLVVMVVVLALIFFIRKKLGFATYSKLFVLSVLPLAFFLLPWIARNYMASGKIIPFQENIYAGYGYKPVELEMRKLSTALGEDGGSFWDPKAMASYFSPERYRTSLYHYPGYIRKDTLLVQQLEIIRNEYISVLPTIKRQEGAGLIGKISSLRNAYIKKHPVRYYLLNPLRRTVKFWGHSGSYYISVEKGNRLILYMDKIIQSALYYLVLILGAVGLWKFGKRNEMGYLMLMPLIFLSMFPLLLGSMEPRYALSFYYPCLVGLVLLLETMQQFFLGKKIGPGVKVSSR